MWIRLLYYFQLFLQVAFLGIAPPSKGDDNANSTSTHLALTRCYSFAGAMMGRPDLGPPAPLT